MRWGNEQSVIAQALFGMGSVVAAIVIWVPGCAQVEPTTDEPSSRLPATERATASDPFEPIPSDLDLDPRWVELGRRLFEEPRVSGDGERACVDCHSLDAGGVVPGEARSNHPLVAGGPYNVPTVFNVAFNFRYNWQGRFETLEDHLGGPMMNENVMNAGSWRAVVERLGPSYDASFVAAGFPEGVSESGVRRVLADYQRSLVTPGSRFDRFLLGELEQSEDEAAGYRLFKDVGCASCHQGINVGGNLYQRFGVMDDAFGGRELLPSDYGRQNVTGLEEDEHVFRVPSLRNVEITPPYFHDGSAATLSDAVRHMGRVQLGARLSENEVQLIVTFLRSLTGEYDGRPLGAAD